MKNNATIIILRLTFFIMMIALTWLYSQQLFRGLNTPEGMDQAQIARELARGNGLSTKVLRPAEIGQHLRVAQEEASISGGGGQNLQISPQVGTLAEVGATNTYHAPLQPILLGAIFRVIKADDFESYRMESNEHVYYLDRVVAGFSMICFLLSIGITYLLVCRIFDSKIASATALSMLLCELFWSLSMSGLPQMLMLLLFTCGIYFAYRAVEASEDGKLGLAHSLLAAVFFSLLALTHWLAIWVVLGYAIVISILVRPRGLSGIITIICLALAVIWPVIVNFKATGNPAGSAFFVLYEGLSGSEELAQRNIEKTAPNVRKLMFQVIGSSFQQTKSLYAYLGAMLAAPIFFISLFHGFKRPPIARFRWLILAMWIFACLGMALFGLSDAIDSNQLHILFAPIMTAYGFAMISVLWSRIEEVHTIPLLSNAHLVAVVLLSASPFLFNLPRHYFSQAKEVPHYPPYAPNELQREITQSIKEDEIVVTDQPWAVAWYADRRAIWLPFKLGELESLEDLADREETPITGILLTPFSSGGAPMAETAGYYRDYLSLILDLWASVATNTDMGRAISARDPKLNHFYNRYPQQKLLLWRNGSPMMLYTSNRIGS